ncbi:hypothetical protein BDR07DRAFT_1435922, partial [Suillus spraguei]
CSAQFWYISGYTVMNLLIIDHLASAIIFEHSFYIFDKRHHLEEQESVSPVDIALKQHIGSPHAVTAREAVSVAVHAYQEVIKTSVSTQRTFTCLDSEVLPGEEGIIFDKGAVNPDYYQNHSKSSPVETLMLGNVTQHQ